MSFIELVQLLREMIKELKDVREEYYAELKPLLKELLDEIRKLNRNLERIERVGRCRKCEAM